MVVLHSAQHTNLSGLIAFENRLLLHLIATLDHLLPAGKIPKYLSLWKLGWMVRRATLVCM